MPVDLLPDVPNYPGLVEVGNLVGLVSQPDLVPVQDKHGFITLIPTIIDEALIPIEQAYTAYQRHKQHGGRFSTQEAAEAYLKHTSEEEVSVQDLNPNLDIIKDSNGTIVNKT